MSDAREARKTPLELRPEWRERARTNWWMKYAMLPSMVAAAIALGGTVGAKVLGFQTTEQAKVEREADKLEVRAADARIETKTDSVVKEVQGIGRDVRVIKCILTAPNTKAKGQCVWQP